LRGKFAGRTALLAITSIASSVTALSIAVTAAAAKRTALSLALTHHTSGRRV